jgi:DNA modification methylase
MKEILPAITSQTIDLIITSPEYMVGKEYEQHRSLATWIATMGFLFQQAKRLLTPTGSLVLQVGNHIDKGMVVPLDHVLAASTAPDYWILKNRIIWTFGHGLHATHRFSGRYETVLWYSLNPNPKFNLDGVRVPQKYPNKRHFKGPKKGELSGNPLGKNPGDFWELPLSEDERRRLVMGTWDIPSLAEEEWNEGVFRISNIKNNHPEKTSHPCQFPEELVRRMVLALTNEGDTVLDPFVGSGTTSVVARRYGRHSIGIDRSEEYLGVAQRRLHLEEQR